MKKRFFLVIVFALLGGGLLYLYLQRFEREATGGAPTTVLVALKPLEPGMTLDESMIAVRSVPRAYVETRAVRESDRARVMGLRVSGPVQAQQTILWTDLAVTTDDRRDLSSLVQPGMRAFSIHAKSEDRSFLLIHPGDRVDLMSVVAQNEHRSASYLLQNVLVLAVGLDTGASPSAAKKAPSASEAVLTVSVTQKDAQLLAIASDRGRLAAVLRHPDDVRVTEKIEDLRTEPAVEAKNSLELAGLKRAPGAPEGPIRLEGRR
jgi:pilus assembly protein CpaB